MGPHHYITIHIFKTFETFWKFKSDVREMRHESLKEWRIEEDDDELLYYKPLQFNVFSSMMMGLKIEIEMKAKEWCVWGGQRTCECEKGGKSIIAKKKPKQILKFYSSYELMGSSPFMFSATFTSTYDLPTLCRHLVIPNSPCDLDYLWFSRFWFCIYKLRFTLIIPFSLSPGSFNQTLNPPSDDFSLSDEHITSDKRKREKKLRWVITFTK